MEKQVKTTCKLLTMALFPALLLGPTPARAQALLSLEGPIRRVLPGRNAMVVLGVRVTVPPGTPITTATTTPTGLSPLYARAIRRVHRATRNEEP
ncbi:MAG: hypothetical protein V2B18_09615 [Pseudomonadota bacterium]